MNFLLNIFNFPLFSRRASSRRAEQSELSDLSSADAGDVKADWIVKMIWNKNMWKFYVKILHYSNLHTRPEEEPSFTFRYLVPEPGECLSLITSTHRTFTDSGTHSVRDNIMTHEVTQYGDIISALYH